MSDELDPLVLDVGGSTSRGGYAGDDDPVVSFPHTAAFVESAVGRQDIRPFRQGCVTDWHALETLWEILICGDDGLLHRNCPDDCLSKLNGNGLDTPQDSTHRGRNNNRPGAGDFGVSRDVLVVESPLAPRVDREKMAQIMFEGFNVASLSAQNSSALTCLASGALEGTVVECHSDHCTAACLDSDSCVVRPSTLQMTPIGGNDIDQALWRLVDRSSNWGSPGAKEKWFAPRESGNSRQPPHYAEFGNPQLANAKSLKESLCSVALDFDQAMTDFKTERVGSGIDMQRKFYMPDGCTVSVGHEMVCAPEVLFKPALRGVEGPALHELTYRALRAAFDEGVAMDAEMCVVGGGTAMLRGLRERLAKEVRNTASLADESTLRGRSIHLSTVLENQLKVVIPPETKRLSWIGGSIVASLSTFQGTVPVTKAEYDEVGPSVMDAKGKWKWENNE